MLASVPSLHTLCVIPELSVMSSEADVGVFGSEGTGHKGLRRVEVHVARRGHWLAFRGRNRIEAGTGGPERDGTRVANPIRIREGLEIGPPTHPHASSFYEDAEETFDRLRRHVRPFAEVKRFPALEEFELKGLAFVCVVSSSSGTGAGRYESEEVRDAEEGEVDERPDGDRYKHEWHEARREMVKSAERALESRSKV